MTRICRVHDPDDVIPGRICGRPLPCRDHPTKEKKSPRAPNALDKLVGELGIQISCLEGAYVPAPFPSMRAWTCTLRFSRRKATTLTVLFFQVVAHEYDPSAADVLRVLISDADGFEGACRFEDWASECGLDPDSRAAEETYKQVERQTARLRVFLGSDYYDRVAEAARESS